MTATPQSTLHNPPPHLTMDEYVTWIQASLEHVDPAKAARQKAIQEQITVPFRIPKPEAPAAGLHRNTKD